MRLGAALTLEDFTPKSWVEAHVKDGYRAAVCPIDYRADAALVAEIQRRAADVDLMIAEVGAWSNPISRDEQVRKEALETCKKQLELAERIGARCCVNIAGSRAAQWDGPHADNFSRETFEEIVESVREIIDAVKPRHTFYTLETMPWIFPDSADTYLELIKAVDRPAFGVHVDPVNMINSPRDYFRNGEIIQDFMQRLGPYILNAHAKDIVLSGQLTVHLDEVMPGQGGLDYRVFLSELRKLHPDTPLILEHLPSREQYRQAAHFIREQERKLDL
ncbi:sugar phosphate isomerase/epimerase family protein [Marinicrinis sediminis]|uniref:Sugar phosphate isomerase/epimerase family protein n=1 Tax=Marinicrinis sediminis TaxID=1652465 RepID=A0ABW5RA26_9BACL